MHNRPSRLGIQDADAFSPEAQRASSAAARAAQAARSLLRAQRNRGLDSANAGLDIDMVTLDVMPMQPTPTYATGPSHPLQPTPRQLLHLERAEIARATRTRYSPELAQTYTVRMPPAPVHVHDPNKNDYGQQPFADVEKAVLGSFGAKTRKDLRPERLIQQGGLHAVALLMLSSMMADCAITAAQAALFTAEQGQKNT